MLPLLAAALLGAALPQETDTTFAVRQGQRLDVNNFAGDIVIKSWRQNSIRLRASHSDRDRVVVDAEGTTVTIRSESRHGVATIDYEILVPAWMPLNLSGVSADETVEGVQAEISAETVEGSVHVMGGKGNIALKSVDGDVTLQGASGHIEINSVSGSVKLDDANGDISAETVDGDVEMTSITSGEIDASTVDGSITYDGTITDQGRYRFATHDGDITIAVPERANVTVNVSTYNGEFDAGFPVSLTSKSRHRFTFTLGSGSARLELESFDGNLNLRRPGQVKTSDEE